MTSKVNLISEFVNCHTSFIALSFLRLCPIKLLRGAERCVFRNEPFRCPFSSYTPYDLTQANTHTLRSTAVTVCLLTTLKAANSSSNCCRVWSVRFSGLLAAWRLCYVPELQTNLSLIHFGACMNFSDTSCLKPKEPEASWGPRFHSYWRIHTENRDQVGFGTSAPQEVSVLPELAFGHLRYTLTGVTPQSNSPPAAVPGVRHHRALWREERLLRARLPASPWKTHKGWAKVLHQGWFSGLDCECIQSMQLMWIK